MLYNLFLRIPVSYMNSLQLLSLIHYDLFIILKNKWWDQYGHGGMENDVEILWKVYTFFFCLYMHILKDDAVTRLSHRPPI